MRIVTLKDVAYEAGVHASTASRALNPATRSGVNIDTAGRVLAAAERLGYQPHPLALGLRTNRTRTVGMVVPNLVSPFILPILAGAQHTLSEAGYSLLVGADDSTIGHTKTAAETFLDRRVDGLIVANAHLDYTPPTALIRYEVPIVLVSRSARDDSFPAIVGDEYTALALMVRHLTELGHTRIAHIAGPQNISTGLYRKTGFIQALDGAGLESSNRLVFEAGTYELADGYAACNRVLDSDEDVTAIIAANDLLALGCIDAIRARGLRVPGDLSVTGYDDISLVDRVEPSLTTVSIPYRAMGSGAAHTLLDLLAEDNRSLEAPHEPVLLPPSLLIRDSTGPIP